MQRKVPLVDLPREVNELWDELTPALERVLRSGHFISGPNVKAFEAEAGEYLGVQHALGLNSGTDALVIGLRALGVSPGDEVITTPFTFVATAEAIRLVGATPVFADIDPRTFNLSSDGIAERITPRTRAIVPVHLFGQPADMEPLLRLARAHGLRVLEDAAQAIGAEYEGKKAGGLADAATFSFFPTKNLGAYGDGGMLVTDDPTVAETAAKLRNHGAVDQYRPELIGYNSRLDELQAAILRLKLRHLDSWNEGRRRVAWRYDEALANHDGIVPPYAAPYARHVYHQYTIRVKKGRRDEVREKLSSAGIGTGVYYPQPLHRLPGYSDGSPQLVEAEQASTEVLNLPVGPHVDPGSADYVLQELGAALPRGV